MRTLIQILLCLTFIVVQIAAADVFIEGITTQSDGNQMTHNMSIKADRVRIEMADKNGMMVAIFRQDKDLFWMVDINEERYTELTRADLQEMRGMIDDAMKQMEEQLKSLPPEQRAMMESMMGDQMKDAMQEPELTYRLIEKDVRLVDKWTCDRYEGYEDGRKVMELWTVEPKDVDLNEKEFAALEAMGEFFSELAPEEGGYFDIGSQKMALGAEGPDFYGIPVKTIHFDENGEQTTTMLGKTERLALDNSLFEVPKGFAKEKLMDGAGIR